VRSGLDLLLSELQWAEGTEVLVSAITIPGVVEILRHHGIRPVPIDLDPLTLVPDETALAQAITSKTRGILVAHLFGSLIPTDRLRQLATDHQLQFWEDCAQAFVADEFEGNPESDIRFFSFGPIKTATALGGGVLLIRDAELRKNMASRQQNWPAQTVTRYTRKLLKFALFKPLQFPPIYGVVFRLLRWVGQDPDQLITRLGRGFGGPDLFRQIRYRPCRALRQMIRRRLSTYDPDRIRRRRESGEAMLQSLSKTQLLGQHATRRTHWLFPVITPNRNAVRQALFHAGFDATTAPSSLQALPPEAGVAAPRATGAMDQILYIPIPAGLSEARLNQLDRIIQSVTNQRTESST